MACQGSSLLAGACLTAIAAAPVSALPLDRALLPPDTAWVLHLDLELAVRSEAKSEVMAWLRAGGRGPLARLEHELSLSAESNLLSVTMIGSAAAPGRGVTLLSTSADINAITHDMLAARHEEVQARREGDYVVYWWHSGPSQGFARSGPRRTRAVAMPRHPAPRQNHVLWGDHPGSVGRLASWLSVPASDRKDAASSLPLDQPQPGSIVFVAASGFEGAAGPRAQMLRDARALVIDMGQESSGAAEPARMVGRAWIDTDTPEQAALTRQVASTMLDFLASRVPQGPGRGDVIRDVVSGVHITTAGNRCVIHSRHDAKLAAAAMTMLRESMDGAPEREKPMHRAGMPFRAGQTSQNQGSPGWRE
ncbi:MAG: hypothetical protein KF859_14305 [Phycisphaeraceae bacterium]|nr:hypothetical protein [Phycisphaeraceae bacterium]